MKGDDMKAATILVVEDEAIVANDLQSRLIGMGYSVPTTSASGQDALQKAKLLTPDLALMDIRLKGEMDGIEAAEQLRDLFDIPCVYLTAYTDDDTLRRAKITEPYGYLVKPFEERELHTAIEMALYRHKVQQQLREKEQWLAAIMPSVQDAIIIASGQGAVISINSVAEKLTGWRQSEAAGQDLRGVFKVAGTTDNPAAQILAGAASAHFESRVCLVRKDGESLTVNCRAVPVHDEKNNVNGVTVVFRESASESDTSQR
jgi:PAS domain S-box-containing protein